MADRVSRRGHLANACGVEPGQRATPFVAKKIRTKRIDLPDLHGEEPKALNVLNVRLAIAIDRVKKPEKAK